MAKGPPVGGFIPPVVAGLLCLGAAGYAAPLKLAYTVEPVPPSGAAAAVTHVTLHVSGLSGVQSVALQMPVWSPGDYHVMNHARFVRGLHASKPSSHPDANTWQIATGGADAVEVQYDLPNTPPGFFSENVKVTERFAFYNGPATYLYVAGHKQDPATLTVKLPAGWPKVVSALDPAGENRFAAPDYDTLADSPLVMGDVATEQFTGAGRPHTIAFFRGQAGMDTRSFVEPIRKIVEEENRLMGGPPYSRYVFFLDVGGPGGGLEHLNGTRIAWSRGAPARFIAGFVAHEFFHLWNVKRIRPAVLGPFDYIDPPKTHNLWFCEGVTSYYGDLSQLRAGLSTPAGYLGGLAGTIGAYLNNPAHLRVSADESSYRVWEAGNSDGYGGLSYYLKGELIGLCLDLKLRHLTSGRASLDTVMRDLLARYGLPKPGYPEDGIRQAVIRAGGAEMGPFYDLVASSTNDIPFAELLGYAGLTLTAGNGRPSIQPNPAATPAQLHLREAWLTGRQSP